VNIIADENIPYAEALFSKFGPLTLLPGRDLQKKDIEGADVLLTRSVTKVNASLLSAGQVQFVGTCTIGVDHIDQSFLDENNIAFSSAPGCNAWGVVQYVLCTLASLDRIDPALKYAVIGCGNVGSRVVKCLTALGLNCIAVDPHLSKGALPQLRSFEAVFDCDVITMHTPLVRDGEYPTDKLISEKELKKLKKDALLINSGRGECIDNTALVAHLLVEPKFKAVLDVWENEPNINVKLHSLVTLGTPHIAGYSFEGRVNGTLMIFEALAKHLGYGQGWIDSELAKARLSIYGDVSKIRASDIKDLLLKIYNVETDDINLSKGLKGESFGFDQLRKNYPKRREFSHYKVEGLKLSNILKECLGFN